MRILVGILQHNTLPLKNSIVSVIMCSCSSNSLQLGLRGDCGVWWSLTTIHTGFLVRTYTNQREEHEVPIRDSITRYTIESWDCIVIFILKNGFQNIFYYLRLFFLHTFEFQNFLGYQIEVYIQEIFMDKMVFRLYFIIQDYFLLVLEFQIFLDYQTGVW